MVKQPSSVATDCVGLQPGQLFAAAGLAETGAALLVDNVARKTDQDRSEGNMPHKIRDVPTCRGGCATDIVRRDS